MLAQFGKLISYGRGWLTSLRHFERAVHMAQMGSLSVYCQHGCISAAEKVRFWPNVRLTCEGESAEKPARLSIGTRTQIGDNTQIHCGQAIEIANDVMISWGCSIMDRDFHPLESDHEERAPIIIEAHAWIGCQCIILKGIRIGEGAIVAAGAVVTRDVPPHTVVAGNPARIVRQLSPDRSALKEVK